MIKENLWEFSKKRGEAVEQYVELALFPSIGIKPTRNNDVDVKNVDLKIGSIPLEVKAAFTPYPKDETPCKLTAQEHLTIDKKDIDTRPRNTVVLFIVRYGEPKVYMISMGAVRDIMDNVPYRKYSRQARGFSDKVKKVGVSTAECTDITGFFPPHIINLINDLP